MNPFPTSVLAAAWLLVFPLFAPPRLAAQAAGAGTDIGVFFDLVARDAERRSLAENMILAGWDDAHTVMLLELHRFAPDSERARLGSILERGTGQRFGPDPDLWWRWIWRTDPGTHPEYARFKSLLYSSIDPTFRDYFEPPPASTIRLDEIR